MDSSASSRAAPLERIAFPPARTRLGSLCGCLLALFRHPWGAMLLQDPILCRIILAVPLPLVALPLLHLPGWPCPFHELTGIPCPGCGMTRAVVALLHGNLAQAVAHHPFVIVAVGAWLTMAVAAFLPEPPRRQWTETFARWERRLAFSGVLLAAFFLFGVGRMALTVWPRFSPPTPAERTKEITPAAENKAADRTASARPHPRRPDDS